MPDSLVVNEQPVQLVVGGQPLGPAGGDLAGYYPAPTIAPGAIAVRQGADAAVLTHERALVPHGGRFIERSEDQVVARAESLAESQRHAKSINPHPQYVTNDQAILAAQFFGN